MDVGVLFCIDQILFLGSLPGWLLTDDKLYFLVPNSEPWSVASPMTLAHIQALQQRKINCQVMWVETLTLCGTYLLFLAVSGST
jgi:hypothetical protein